MPVPVMPAPVMPARNDIPRRAVPSTASRPTTPMAPVDEGRRARILELMRELGPRVAAALGLSTDPATRFDDATWGRAERSAVELIEERSASLPPGVDGDQLAKDVVAETLGLGPLEELLQDESVRELAVTRFDHLFVDRNGQLTAVPRYFSSAEALQRVIERLLLRSGRGADLAALRASGGLEARLDGGLLLSCALPPLAARGPSLTLRRPRRTGTRLGDLVAHGMLSQAMADFLELALKTRRNIIVSGPAQSGRSTVLGALARTVEGERIVSVEEHEELDLGEGPWIPLVGRGPNARQALGHALRLRPDRLVLGDLRGAEALDLVGAMAGGAEGVLAAIQAASPREAVGRLESLARLAPEAPTGKALADEIARGVHVVVHLGRASDGEIRVVEIVDLGGGGQPVFAFKPDSAGGRFAAAGHVPAWAEGAPSTMFRS
jgi:pilus assembly protein CpaF